MNYQIRCIIIKGDTIIKNSKLKIKNFKHGFTLLEIIILLSIISIMMSGILTLFFNVITVNKSAEYYSTAYKLMDSKIEELRGTSFETIIDDTYQISELPQGEGIISISNEIDGAPQSDIIKVDLNISWYFKKKNQIREVTYITKGGIKK